MDDLCCNASGGVSPVYVCVVVYVNTHTHYSSFPMTQCVSTQTAHIFRAPLGNNYFFQLSFVHGRQDDGHEEVGRTV